MRKSIIALALSGFLAMQANADEVQLQDTHPDRYVVAKGDTLWFISDKFLKQPWRWPELWSMNKAQIKNPDLIYPGDVMVLDKSGKSPKLRLIKNTKYAPGGKTVVKLSPTTRIEAKSTAIPAIPTADILPFLTQPLVIEETSFNDAATIIATEEGRVAVGAGDVVYVDKLNPEVSDLWQAFRRGAALTDPETKELLGYEAIYLGEGKVSVKSSPVTVKILKSPLEIIIGDKLLPTPKEGYTNYVPHAPDKPINARIMSVYGGASISEAGPSGIVTINKGQVDGLETGHILALYRHGASVKSTDPKVESLIKLPDERYGLIFVFRTFNRVSYALIISASRSVHVLDNAQTP